MNPEQFLKEFNTFINAPNGIQQLREYIWHLAVNGALSLGEFSDKSSAVNDFNSLIESRENNDLKVTKWVEDNESSFSTKCPNSWVSCHLGEVVSIRTGHAFKSADYVSSGERILRVTNINTDGSFNFSNVKFFNREKIDKKIANYYLEAGEVIVVMVGGSLGKSSLIIDEILPSLLNQNMWRLKPYSEKLLPEFLYLTIKDLNNNRLEITPSTHGHLKMGAYASNIIFFPSLNEQERIVARVDELMELCDQLEEEQQAAEAFSDELRVSTFHHLIQPEKPQDAHDALQILVEESDLLLTKPEDVEDLRKLILDLAVRGKFSERNRSDKSVDVILEEADSQRNKTRISPNPGVVERFNIPSSWCWCLLDEITDQQLGKMLNRQKMKGKPIHYLRSVNVQTNRIDLTDLNEMLIPEDELEKYSVRRGDIFVVEGGHAGRSAIFDRDPEELLAFQNQLHRLRPLGGISSRFLHLLLWEMYVSGYLSELAQGLTIQHLSASSLRGASIPIPPLEEQERIVARVDELMELCNQLEEKLSLTVGLSEEYVLSSSPHLVS